MDTTLTFIDLAGSIALLLWGVHMVQTGIQRAFGPDLRRLLAAALGNRLKAFAAGLGVTAVLQSSTATGLMISSFAAAGFIDLASGLAVMLGANVGTTLIVQLLSFDVTRIAPPLVLLGVLMFRRGTLARTRDLGRVAIGLGLMLIALGQVLQVLTPFEDVPSLRILLGMIATAPIVALLFSAALTWLAHSSVAVILLVMSFASRGVVPPHAAFALVLGANLGTAINPVLESAGGNDPAAKRLPLGNLINRLVGCGLALAALDWIGPVLVTIEPDSARAVADFHTAFNLVLALLFLPALEPFSRLLQRWIPNRVDAPDPSQPLYLDPAAREIPSLALASAAREALRMADALEAMLHGVADAFDKGDRTKIAETKRIDDTLDRLNTAIKAYLTVFDPDAMANADNRRLLEILTFTTNIEHAGDVLERDILGIVNRQLKRGLKLSTVGKAEILGLIDRLCRNLRSCVAVFMTEDAGMARLLADEKEAFRDIEAAATQAHFMRLRAGAALTAETSSLHLDLIRDLKRVNAHLVAAAAYPVLKEQGELLPSRVRSGNQD
ncbi:membrane protein [Aliidongia dinghuensis]|uniref:Membrane protein n=1 Tax=Aliidongia dinghuensis TaxID=1867774 RepID=A0A8J2YYY2_9PROT|nr:Na/Pi cotransporter family protein [Aliidongia dinghuensis]GGF40860.1 membrane protein [Aliidongia dinghuensis]